MARTRQITNGTLTVDVIDTADPGIIAERGGFGEGVFAVDHGVASGYDGRGKISRYDVPMITERWKLFVRGSSHDNLASQVNALQTLLRLAARYHLDPTVTDPVYIKEQLTNEGQPRFALVYGSPELRNPDFFAPPIDPGNLIDTLGISVVREGVWRHREPGTLPGSDAGYVGLDAVHGPASPTQVHLSNFRDVFDITHIYNFDFSAGTFSGNLLGAAFTYFPAVAAVDDYIVFGCNTPGPFKHIVANIGMIGVFTATLVIEYSTGAGTWAVLTAGTGYVMFPEAASFLKVAGHIVLSIKPPSDWVAAALNGITAHWIRIRLNPFTSMGTNPTNTTFQPYAQRTPEIRWGSSAVSIGTFPPLSMIRMAASDGAANTPGFETISRIIIGAKSRGLTNFVSNLNLGNGAVPSGWANAYGTDTASAADSQGPANVRADCTFATDTSEVRRVTLTGTARLADWIGTYRVFVRCQQVGGAAGDVKLKLRTNVYGTTSSHPKYDLPNTAVALVGVSLPWEIVELGTLALPWAKFGKQDSLANVDIIFQILASRASGSATLRLYDLILIPIDEWTVELNDPLADTVNGTSALRGLTSIEDDGGLVLDRTVKYIRSGSSNFLAETWSRRGEALTFEPARAYRLYFLAMNYASNWGVAPFVASLGTHLDFKMWVHERWPVLRGAN